MRPMIRSRMDATHPASWSSAPESRSICPCSMRLGDCKILSSAGGLKPTLNPDLLTLEDPQNTLDHLPCFVLLPLEY